MSVRVRALRTVLHMFPGLRHGKWRPRHNCCGNCLHRFARGAGGRTQTPGRRAGRGTLPKPCLAICRFETRSPQQAQAVALGAPQSPSAPPSRAMGGGQRCPPPTMAAHHAMTRVTMPAPTVLLPSRMAKRDFASIAIGLSSSTVSSALSPGSTISAPSLRSMVPVTSVVWK